MPVDPRPVRFWSIVELPGSPDRVAPHTFSVPATGSRVLHSLLARYQHTHRLAVVQRRHSGSGASCARIVLTSRIDPADQRTIHAMLVTVTAAR